MNIHIPIWKIPRWILQHSHFQYVFQKWIATPSWYEPSKIAELEKFAKLKTNSTGTRYVIDHIVPLNSKYVCGLHCQQNWQVISAAENYLKGNRWWPDMWMEQICMEFKDEPYQFKFTWRV